MVEEEKTAVRPKVRNAPTTPALIIGGIGLVRSLAHAGIPFYVGTDVHEAPILHSRYTKRVAFLSDFSSESFVDDLVTLARSTGERMPFFSDDDRAVLTFSQYRQKLEQHFAFNMPEADLVDAVLDKQKFVVLANQLGLPVPWSFAPGSREELRSLLKDIRYPCIMKPAHKEDWWHPDFVGLLGKYRKAIECYSESELTDIYDKVCKINPHVVIQELVLGTDSQLFSMNMYFDKNCELLGHFIAQKFRVYPIHAGQGCLVETITSPEIYETGLEAAKKLKIKGFFNIQFKRDVNSGKLKIMEVHIRNSVWNYLGTASGVNLLAIGYYDALGLDYPGSKRYQTGVKFIDIKRDVKSLNDYRKAGEWTIGSYLKSLRGKRVYDMFKWSDPMPFIMDFWFEFKRRLSRPSSQ